MAEFRNPHTSGIALIFNPRDMLQTTIRFRIWEGENPVTHSQKCKESEYHELLINGMCCIPSLKACIETRLLNLCGIRLGIFLDVPGYNRWLVLAQKRLKELEQGHDDHAEWTEILKEFDSPLYEWINTAYDMKDPWGRVPGFSLQSYTAACKRYDFYPPISDVAIAFGFPEETVMACRNSLSLPSHR